MSNLKKYYILRFSIPILDYEKRKGTASYSILLVFFIIFLNFLYFPFSL